MAFYVGQKVVAIKRPDYVHPVVPPPGCIRLKVGEVYTIRDIDTRAVGLPRHEAACLRFEEIVNPAWMTSVGMWEMGYDARCFRPVAETKTDISVFQEILDRETFPVKPPVKV